MIEHIDKVAEYYTLAKLLEMNVEAYAAISHRQEHFDIIAIRKKYRGRYYRIIQIQVKGTELKGNKASSVANLNREFDILVIVVMDRGKHRYFIMTQEESMQVRYKETSPSFSITRQVNGGEHILKESLLCYEENWDPIIS